MIEFKVAVAAVGDYDGGEVPADAFRYAADAAGGRDRIVTGGEAGRDRLVPLTFQDIVDQFTGNRHFCFRVFAEGDADRIAYAVSQQGSYADGAFDTAVFAVSGFCYSQVKWVVHTFGFHCPDEQAYGLHHYDCVGCFDGDNYIREILVPADTQELHAGSYHSFGGITIPAHDAVGQ